MRICDLATGSSRIQKAAKLLQEKWAETQIHWHDKTSQDFEKNYLKPLLPKVSIAVSAIGRLNEVLDQAERDCDEGTELE